MRKKITLLLFAIALEFSSAAGALDSQASNAAEAETQKIVTASTAFLDSLNATQRAKVQFGFTP